MRIKQVEELVNITSKNIRFYEDQGLLFPERAENGYREYHEKEIEILKRIKLFRKFDISISDIKSILNNEKDFRDCLDKSITELKRKQSDLEKIQILAQSMLMQSAELDKLDTDKWIEEVERMERKGADFVNLEKVDIHRKKKAGALLGGTLIMLAMGISIGIIVWASMEDPIPLPMLLILILIPSVVIISIIVAIYSRIKEIEGGEEDEASKY